jgi:hypothetical protein
VLSPIRHGNANVQHAPAVGVVWRWCLTKGTYPASARASDSQLQVPPTPNSLVPHNTVSLAAAPAPPATMAASIDSKTLEQYLADDPPSIVNLVIKPHFEALSDQEKLYAHHLSR